MNARALALAALREWRAGRRFADAILQDRLERSQLRAADRAFATELFYGVLRRLTLLDFLIDQLRSAALEDTARDLLRLGLYQLLFLRTPGHAAIFETVALASPRRRSLINAVLRSAQRRLAQLESAAADAPLYIRASHPQFLLERWTQNFGAEQTDWLCRWNNRPAPIYARVNRLRTSLEDFSREHPSAERVAPAANFVRLAQLPLAAVAAGACYVQDPSTRIACEMLAPQPGDAVLDACAAPGGKSALLAELMENRGDLVACDRDPARVALLRENLARLGVTTAKVLTRDWQTDSAMPEGVSPAFDRILLDAPCTNTGVMRRRVDVRWRLRPEDFARMAGVQWDILRTIVPLLKPGGALVYSTCSMEAEENEQIVARALAAFPFLVLEEQTHVLPFRDHFDGAFAARLCREK